MVNRHLITMLVMPAAVLQVALPDTSFAQQKSSVHARGAGQSGPLATERCNPGPQCKIEVRAGLGPIDDEGEIAGQRECVIRVPIAKATRKATTSVIWELSTQSINRGFSFRDPGVAIDNAGQIFGTPTIDANRTKVEVPLLTTAFTSASSYTVYLKFKKPAGILEFDCDGLDPIIVSRD